MVPPPTNHKRYDMLTNLNFPVLEVSSVEQIQYQDPDAPGAYHLDINLLLDVNGHEVVCCLSGSVDQFRDLLDPLQDIKSMVQEGTTTRCVGILQFRDLLDEYDLGADH